jgi:hypothetical protein
VNNARQNDSCIIIRKVDFLENMGKLPNNSLHEVKICGTECGTGVKNTTEIWAVPFLIHTARQKSEVSHGRMNYNWDRRLTGGSGGKDNNILEKSDTAALSTRGASEC